MNKKDQHQAFLRNLSSEPGVYRFYGHDDQLLYVGKAKHLNARVSSYFQSHHSQPKVNAMVAKVDRIEVTIVASEQEALLLEHTLINAHSPMYNVVMRDDASYPYLYLSKGNYPRLQVHRGARRGKGQYFGPYPDAKSVRNTLNILQKNFKIRHCSDAFFKARKRPCLQYQIGRCSAPCVGMIDSTNYLNDVAKVVNVLKGQDDQVIAQLIKKMRKASDEMAYEEAKSLRDTIAALQSLRAPQNAVTQKGDIDVVTVLSDQLHFVVLVLMIRHGQLLGHHAFFPKVPHELAGDDVLAQFILSHYRKLNQTDSHPTHIILAKPLPEHDALSQILSDHFADKIQVRASGQTRHYNDWLAIANKNAQHALEQKRSSHQSLFHRFEGLAHVLKSDIIPERIDCFDISHFQGDATIGSCVVCGQNGPMKSLYRRYGISDHTPGDDYGALKQMLTKHYRKLKQQDGDMPDVILIDGGKGQLTQIEKVCAELQLSDVILMAIAKGPSRKPGLEMLHISGQASPISLAADSPALHLLQFVRDEAHRFAITGHRKRRDKRWLTSVLEGIPGVGKAKRSALLEHFGGLQGVRKASAKSLAQIPGIGPKLASTIVDYLKKQDQ
jgi:excinuclease ABC subunit C